MKRGQTKLSFGMIFSIILIVIFLAFGFYVIAKFLGFMDTTKVLSFQNDFQNDIDKAWKATQASTPVTYQIPSGMEYICIADLESPAEGEWNNLYRELRGDPDDKVYFYPRDSADQSSVEIRHIDLEKTLENNNPYCIKVSRGKASMILKKDIGDALVTIQER